MERRRFLVLYVWALKRNLVTIMHNWRVGNLYMRKKKQHGYCHILRMSINEASRIVGFESWTIYVLIGCSHPSMRFWQPLGANTTPTCSLPHPNTEFQWSVNDCQSCILGDQGIARIFQLRTELLTAWIGKNANHTRRHMHSRIIDIANCKTCKKWLLDVE